MIRFILLAVLLALPPVTQSQVVFQDEDSVGAFSNQDVVKNLIKAEEGDVRAQVLVGAAYLYGLEEKGVEADHEKGLYWLKEAANQGAAEAHYELGRMYCHGMGVDKDPVKCEEHLNQAAERGLSSATTDLMDIYQSGDAGLGIEADEEKYLYWLETTAEDGVPISMRNMARRYRQGRGFEVDFDKAFEWIMRAVELDAPFSHREAARYFENGWGTEQDLVKAYMLYDLGGTAGIEPREAVAEQMTEAQIEEAIARSWQWQLERSSFVPSSKGYRYQPDVSDLEPLSLTPESDQ
ncbi:tetratricopeptide repeat protein [Halomonas mongoliensis]|uniref:tetratricopeptide repeat protein n=1 Tax=Halomonas mongoliensis TaxID=321265 RepID=UPI00403AB7D7